MVATAGLLHILAALSLAVGEGNHDRTSAVEVDAKGLMRRETMASIAEHSGKPQVKQDAETTKPSGSSISTAADSEAKKAALNKSAEANTTNPAPNKSTSQDAKKTNSTTNTDTTAASKVAAANTTADAAAEKAPDAATAKSSAKEKPASNITEKASTQNHTTAAAADKSGQSNSTKQSEKKEAAKPSTKKSDKNAIQNVTVKAAKAEPSPASALTYEASVLASRPVAYWSLGNIGGGKARGLGAACGQPGGVEFGDPCRVDGNILGTPLQVKASFSRRRRIKQCDSVVLTTRRFSFQTVI